MNEYVAIEYVTITKTTLIPKLFKFFVVCSSTQQLTGFRSKRPYASLGAERLALSDRGLIALILMAGGRLRHLPLRRTLLQDGQQEWSKGVRRA